MPDRPGLTIRTVIIPVADQERSLAFYRDVLGFEITADRARRHCASARLGASWSHDHQPRS
ncbi:hypothetical protein ASF62_14695 [Leifsonia sp. Leaf325]|nr:VOC family protein [Leifsonia sp. Leaf325]KQQ93015.1 hypothetical protein ASF62_14695 [Leifsonia sp. Leaf325]